MSKPNPGTMKLPPAQKTIQARCSHPSGSFVEFSIGDVEASIPERFEKIVAMHSSHIAVKMGDEAVTYGALDAMANRVAHCILKRRGPAPEPVPLLLHRGINQIAIMLGVLQAGKFFVLLDASSPRSRIAGIMKDLDAGILLSDRQNHELAAAVASHSCSIVVPNATDSTGPTEAPRLIIKPSDIADIRFSSGSTGKPKGVIQIHRNLLYQILLYTNLYKICPDDRISVLTANTGNTITSIFMALLNGATALPFDVQEKGVKGLIDWLQHERISFTMLSSPLFRTLCESLTGTESFSDLRMIRLASEGAYRTDLDLYKKHFPPTSVLANALSSGETNLLTTFYVDHKTEITGDDLPVGYAVEGKEITLLDDTGRAVGPNQIGEIIVRSKYLSPGYWNNPELTQAKFKPDPHHSEKRKYYTGDLGLMLPDGCLIHKGRKDFRIKIRGYGVDLVEVQTALLSHPGIREAVVIARADEHGAARLIAYFTSDRTQGTTVRELRRSLKMKLPDYMIPSVFVKLEKIPLTSNGKVDRGALPMPPNSRPELDTAFVAPRSQTERRLAEIWAEVLALDRVGVYDNFFDLRGHSLAAARVVARVFQQFQLEIPLRALFESPTVAEMAAVINEHQGRTLHGRQLEEILTELESLSEEQVQRLVSHQSEKE